MVFFLILENQNQNYSRLYVPDLNHIPRSFVFYY
jgi:hypothetical protein